MARDIYAHVPPFGEAKVWSDEAQQAKEEMKKAIKPAGIGIAPEFEDRVITVKQVRLNGWYTREDLIKILAMKEMQ